MAVKEMLALKEELQQEPLSEEKTGDGRTRPPESIVNPL